MLVLRARSIKITVVSSGRGHGLNIYMVHVYSVHAFIGLLSSCEIFGLRWIRMELGRRGVDKPSAV